MTTYKYKAISGNGAPVTGIIEGYDEYDAVARIKAACPVITKIEEQKEAPGILTAEVGPKQVNNKSLSVFCSQIGIILKAGMPIAKCMDLITDQTEDKKLKKLLGKVRDDVSSGRSLADSFEDVGKDAFPVTFIETVRAGEQAGTLDHSFKSLAEYYEKRYKTRQKVSSALSYPIFVMCIAVVVVAVIMIKVIPTLTAVFKDLGGNLPPATKFLIASSNFMSHYFLFILGAVILIIIGVKWYGHTEQGHIELSKHALKRPVFGKIAMLNASSQFANTMATLLTAGLPVPKALEVTGKTMDNYFLGMETAKMVTGLETGKHLGSVMEDMNCYPRTLNEMASIGEETGELEETLKTIGAYYDNEADQATQKMLAKLEPTLLIVLAIVAGFIVVSIYLPIFTMYDLM